MTDEHTALTERRAMVNALLDAIAHEKGLRERAIVDAYFAERAHETLSALLRDTASLPDDLVVYCQHLLNPAPTPEKDPAA